MSLIQNEAFVTLVTSDNYVAGACVLARSLQQSGTLRRIWCLASKTLAKASLETLHAVFHGVSEVDIIDSGDVHNLALLGRPELGPTFTKLQLWRLEQFDKVVFMDADTLVLRNIDDLFEREEFSACSDVGWPDCFNSGVFVAKPSEDTYTSLIKMALEEGSFDGGDQGLLNAFFSGWSTGPSSKRIPFTYNLTINASYSYAPAFARFRSEVRVIHFIGSLKPWTFHRLSDGCIVPRGDASNVNLEFVQEWWKVYDAMIHGCEGIASLSFLPCGMDSSSACLNRSSQDVGSPYASGSFNKETSPSNWANGVDSDFASYRVKWSADVEKYFQSSCPPCSSNLNNNLFSSSVNSSIQQQRNLDNRYRRIIGSPKEDAEEADSSNSPFISKDE